MKLLMITGDKALAQGKRGPFYYMLEEFSKYWDRVDIICPLVEADKRGSKRGLTQKVHGNVFIHSSSRPLWRQPWFILRKGLEIYKKGKFDLFTIHSYPPFYNDIGGYWLYKKLSSRTFRTSSDKVGTIKHRTFPYVLEIMHITGYPKAENFKEWLYKILTRLFIKYFAKKAKAIRVINKKQAPEFLKKAGVDEKKMIYMPAFYIDFDIFKPQNLDKKYDLVFAGRLVENKGILLLLEAAKHLVQVKRSNISNIKLVIIGSGPLEKKIKKYIKKHKLESNVKFAGWLPSIKDVAKIYNQSKIFVMPSFNEGGPRVNLEAMACKVPVITSKVGVMLDIINPGENGIFIDWDVKDVVEKIKLLLEDKVLYKKIAENGYQTVQQFERKKAIKFYAKSYKKLISVRNV